MKHTKSTTSSNSSRIKLENFKNRSKIDTPTLLHLKIKLSVIKLLDHIVNSPNTLVNKIYINTDKTNKWVTLTQIIVNFILIAV
jgi:hypothetical protein